MPTPPPAAAAPPPPRTAAVPGSDVPVPAIDRRRYRRVLGFFARTFVHLVWCDVVLRLPGLHLLRSDPLRRYALAARRFRALAVEMGGVLIKLGQYLSARVDLLPTVVTRELAGLQDEVPPADFAVVARQIEEDFGRPLGEVFSRVSPEPLGAASLAQVHEAWLPDGQAVVVKVLRPGIEVVVETDLRAIGKAMGWVKWWRFVRQRVDLDWVMAELAGTTRRELDLQAEGRYAERFAENFAGDADVYLPRVYWGYTARRTLTEENVAFLKIADHDALRAAGIPLAAVARQLYRVYMRQIFVHNLVHADPHPGNLFIKPLATPLVDAGAGETAEVPFQIVFVDFGMVAEIPPRLRAALRRFLIGLGSRDAGLVIQALREAGYLLPGADLAQLEEALESVFDRFWGVEVGRLNNLMMSAAAPLWEEFGRLLLETPIQVQADLMFAGRAVELLGALASDLDAGFNPWAEAVPFAEMLAAETASSWQEQALNLLAEVRRLATLPGDLSRVASLAQRGRLVVRTALTADVHREVRSLTRAIDRLGVSVVAAAMFLAGALLHGARPVAGSALVMAAVVFWLATRWRR